MRRTFLLGSLILLAGCGAHSAVPSTAPSTASGAPERSTVVPWRPLPPRRATIPVTFTQPSPDPVPAEHTRRCRGSDLLLDWRSGSSTRHDDRERRGGPRARSLVLRSVRSSGLVARTVEGATIPGSLEMWTVRSHGPVLVTTRQHALVQLTWPSACLDDRPGGSSLTLEYAGRSWTGAVRYLSDVCDFGQKRRLGSIGVSRFVPLHHASAHRISAFSGIRVRVPRIVSARVGGPLDFVLTMVAPRRVLLAPCPDYRIGATPGYGTRAGLNCAGVPWRDDQGRPFLPAHVPVRFEMRLGAVPDSQKYWWGLATPGRAPFTVGLVHVR